MLENTFVKIFYNSYFEEVKEEFYLNRKLIKFLIFSLKLIFFPLICFGKIKNMK
jgi:hypothetical protein